MQEAGEVVRADVVLTDSGRSKGYGFVEFKDAEDAELAVNSLNGAMLKGREISVRIEMDAAGGRRDLYVAESTAAVATSNRVYVGNLTYEVEWKDLKDLMRSAGSVVRADILTDPRTGRSRGCGIVEFARTEDAVRAISTLNQTEVMGRKIFIREDREPAGAWMVQGEAEGQSAGDGGMENRVFIGNLLFEVAWQV